MTDDDFLVQTASSASVGDPPTERPRCATAIAATSGARFIGETTMTREGEELVVTGPRVSEALYFLWHWACVLLVLALLAWGLWWPGGSVAPGIALALALLAVWAGGLLLMGYRSQVSTVRMPLSAVRELSVGFRPRVWHVVLLLVTSGLAVVLFIPMYRNRYRTVSFLGDDGEGDPVRYRFEARDEREAIKLASLLAE